LGGRQIDSPTGHVTQDTVFTARREALGLTLADSVANYIAALVDATRHPEIYSEQLRQWLRWGLVRVPPWRLSAAHGHWPGWDGRDYVSPEDVQAIAPTPASPPAAGLHGAGARHTPASPALMNCCASFRP